MPTYPIIECAFCGTPFRKKRPHHIFCRSACRVQSHRREHGIPEPDFHTMKSVAATQRTKIAVQSSAAKAKMEELYAKEEQEIFDLRQRIETIKKYLAKPKPRYEEHEHIKSMGLPSLSFTPKHPFWDGITPALNKINQQQGTPLLQTEKEKRIGTLQAEIDRCRSAISAIYNVRTQRRKEQNPAVSSSAPISTPPTETALKATLKPSSSPPLRSALILPQVVTAAELRQAHGQNVPTLNLSGMYEQLFGATIGTAPYIVVWGDAGSGKTGFVLKLLKHLRRAGSVLFCTAETSLDGSPPFLRLAETTQTTDIPLTAIQTVEAFQNILEQHNYQCIALDSASRLAIAPNEMLRLRNLAPSMGVIVLLESTKSGASFKGSNEWKHHCNIMVRVEATWNEDGSRRGSRYVVEKNQWGHQGVFAIRYA